MATRSKYEQGYDDNRFEIVVGEEFHCSICLLVLKDPVMCKNQHCYCSSCIKEHLANSKFCPTCREHLDVDTLIQAPRIVTEYLSKLNIHCDFYPRGCREVLQLSNLKRHVANCGFSPLQCSNDGCNVLVNKRDKFYHEAEVCDFRKSKCHDCSQFKKEVKEIKDEMLHRQDQMKNEMEEMKGQIKEMIDQVLVRQGQLENKIANEIKEKMKNEIKEMKEEMKNEIKELIDQVFVHQGLLENKIENKMKEGMKNEMKGGMKNEMKEIVMNAVREVMAGKKDLEVKMKNSKQSSQATCSSDERENIIVAGGKHIECDRYVRNKSTESFNWADQTWTLLNSAGLGGHSDTCSFRYQGQMVVTGGIDNDGNRRDTLKCLNVANPAATWKDFGVNLPFRCSSHQVVNYKDRLFISGGMVQDDRRRTTRSDAINEVQLVPPYSRKMLTRLPQPRSNHGMELFDGKLIILGGHDDTKITTSVVQFDLIKKECKEMPPLPYAVAEMATVLWQNNVLVIGGRGERSTLNTVFMYDVTTGRSQMLPRMKSERRGCTAILTGNVVVAMGGKDEKYVSLKSAEYLNLERQVWQDLPDMLEPRVFATAVVKPNH